ncbi:MAG TPA: cytochrome c-type biogenesis CcmF C-terminal domain-containing protein [Marmoricola sp.]|nr:cytochrome c-type biogenesis CcmF C-terminal domain-containing protein [Marmoricola sp.]
MTGWLGTFSLAFALCASLGTAAVWASTALRGRSLPSPWLSALPLVGAAGAVGSLEWALLHHDFALKFVAENGSLSTPTYYTVTSLWAAHDGSLLLWVLILTVFVLATGLRRRGPADLRAWAMAVLCLVTAFFSGLALFTGDVFDRVWPVPADGPGPNPLLSDHPAMGIHPPLLYAGLLGLAVPFSFAVAALVTGRVGREWVAAVRSSALVAWILLTAGIVMGAWWSYAVLGWGGYWAWDPVENASLMPWLTATALLHSCMVQRRRRALPMWNLSLAVASFLLACLASFLTRSGVVTSVHAFAASSLGPILLGFLAALAVGTVALVLVREDRFVEPRSVGRPLSRGPAIVLNSVLLVALTTTVLIGTLFPVVTELATGTRLSVGPPYFNRVAVPIALLLLLHMGVGPFLRWRGEPARPLLVRVLVSLTAGAVTVAVVAALAPAGILGLVAFGVAAHVLAGIALDTALRVRHAGGGPMRWLRDNRRRAAGLLVHTGVVVATVGIAASSSYTHVEDRTLHAGQPVRFAGEQVRLIGVSQQRSSRGATTTARLDLAGQTVAPALRYVHAQDMTVALPAILSSPTGDVYLTLLSADTAGKAELRLAVNPMVGWIWAGGALMVAGGIGAAWPRRRRTAGAAEAAEAEPAREPASGSVLVGER